MGFIIVEDFILLLNERNFIHLYDSYSDSEFYHIHKHGYFNFL